MLSVPNILNMAIDPASVLLEEIRLLAEVNILPIQKHTLRD